MQIICTGASGLVGSNFVESAVRRGHKVAALCNSSDFAAPAGVEVVRTDLTDTRALERLVIDRFPDAIVNCAAMSRPLEVDADPARANLMNAVMPERLAQLANHVSARLIHLSTDMVFHGTAAPYKNTDVPSPANLYGQTKLLAEKAVLKYAAPLSVVLRISHVCGNGPSGRRSFNEKLFSTWAQGRKIRLNDNEIKRFLSAGRLGDLLVELAERPNISGIYHYCGLDSLSYYEAGVGICEFFGLDPEKHIERASLPERRDFTLDMSCLADKVKTPSSPFSELLLEMKVPDACAQWYENETGRRQVKRYKL